MLVALAVGQLPAADDIWGLVHVLAGAALGYCYWRLSALLGELRYGARYVLAFSAACSTTLAWEIGEFMADQALGTALQYGVMDTMSDLTLGVCGAAAYLAWHALSGWKAQAARSARAASAAGARAGRHAPAPCARRSPNRGRSRRAPSVNRRGG